MVSVIHGTQNTDLKETLALYELSNRLGVNINSDLLIDVSWHLSVSALYSDGVHSDMIDNLLCIVRLVYS